MKFKNKVIISNETLKDSVAKSGKKIFDFMTEDSENSQVGVERSDNEKYSDKIVSFNSKTLEWSFQEGAVWFCGMIEQEQEEI